MGTDETTDGHVAPDPGRGGPPSRSRPARVVRVDIEGSRDPQPQPGRWRHEPLPSAGVVKICGLREPVHAAAAAAAGADLLGFIFAPAPRRVTAAAARECIGAARTAADGRRILAVGVFVDATPNEMNAAADAAGLDLLQLHGDEPPAMLAELSRPVVKVLRPPPGTPVTTVAALADRYRVAANAPIAFLVEGFAAGAAGGTGISADWNLARDLAARGPLILAGGLDPGTVVGAITAVRPLGVDVSSGVETDGAKDAAKIAAFVAAARNGLRTDPPRWNKEAGSG